MRRGYWFIPKHIFGRPSDEWTVTGPQLPARIMQLGAQAILRLYFGDLRKLGLPKPDHRIFETHPLLNDQLIHHLRHGDISIRGDVSLFDGHDVVFADGSRGSYDLVLACTGFHHAVPYAGERFGGYVDSHALHVALADELEALGLDARRDRLGGLAG